MKKIQYFFTAIFILQHIFCFSQTAHKYGFDIWNDAEVSKGNDKLINAWAGGMNNVQFGEIDMNFDGQTDLLIFDKHGNRLLPFIFMPAAQPYYQYSPSYARFFPPVNSLFQLKDYNGDGKSDLFTYTTGGIMVYRNISESSLRFEKAVKQFIKSLQGDIYTNLLITNVDYPVIHDLDEDGDLDILTFWGLGSFMELHQSMSVETYGVPDSLLYHKVDVCWGNFAEGAESNSIVLDTCQARPNDRHTGSTMLALDLNNDEILDLTLGDVDYGNIKALINGGDNINALMTEVIDSFPAAQPVNIISFPSMQVIDAYNDGIPNLVASPFDPGLHKSAGNNSVWLYNISETDSFSKTTESFLQNQMIDVGLGSYPILAKVTDDDLYDLIIGNYGNLVRYNYNENGQLICDYTSGLTLYENTGTNANPRFTFVTDNFAGLTELADVSIHPAFADMNNDGLSDIVAGTGDGRLLVIYSARYGSDGIPQYGSPREIYSDTDKKFLTPTIADLNNDGLPDCLAGNQTGRITYLRNTGTPEEPVFQDVSDFYGSIDVTDYNTSYTGYSVPSLFTDNQGNLNMVVGSESGKIFFYTNITDDHTKVLQPQEDAFTWLSEGIRTSASLSDLNNDGYYDMVTGNFAGGVTLYKGKTPSALVIEENVNDIYQLTIYPNPAADYAEVIMPENAAWKISIYNYQGQKVRELSTTGIKTLLRFEGMRSGLYVIVASRENDLKRKYTNRLVITR
jgi:hypothetical protein